LRPDAVDTLVLDNCHCGGAPGVVLVVDTLVFDPFTCHPGRGVGVDALDPRDDVLETADVLETLVEANCGRCT